MKTSIYVCHTYYHVYVSILKELAKPIEEQGYATIVLSKMSTEFENLKDRLINTNYFAEVLEYDEKSYEYFPELEPYKKPSKNFVKSIFNRIVFTKRLAKLQEQYIPTDFTKYDEIYLYCDSDPIGYYLNYKHIYYHAMEDGLDTLKARDHARADNYPHFGLKVFLSKKLNLIFVQNGYGKYCIDMEVNNNKILQYPCPYRVEVSREELYKRLTPKDKEFLLSVFVVNREKIESILSEKDVKSAIILTEPLCELAVRKKIFTDLANEYEGKGYKVIFKQHPRDYLDYEKEFEGYTVIDRRVPMEILNLFENNKFELVVSVFTELSNVYFANNKIRLGRDFMDAYEDESMHAALFVSD